MNKDQIYQIRELGGLAQWTAPEGFTCFYHHIPIDQIEMVRGILKAGLLGTNFTYIFRFRGSRTPGAQSTRKDKATHFAIFIVEKKPRTAPPVRSTPTIPQFIYHEGRRYQLVE